MIKQKTKKMYNKIIKNIEDGVPTEDIYLLLENITSTDIENIIRNIDLKLKDLLYQQSSVVHASMESYHNADDVTKIREQFKIIEIYLKQMVYSKLPIHKRLYLSILDFFVEPYTKEDIEKNIETIQTCRKNISTYNSILNIKSQYFIKLISFYQNWIILLNKLTLEFFDRNDPKTLEIKYYTQRILMQASEFLSAQRQLESTIKLQMQNNQTTINDTLHIITVSQSIIQNTLSIENFFNKEYIGSVNIIKKYIK